VARTGRRTAKAAFGATIRRLRLEKGFSQEALAERASLHRTYVGSIERGERNVSLENMLKLAGALSVPLHEVIRATEAHLGLPAASS